MVREQKNRRNKSDTDQYAHLDGKRPCICGVYTANFVDGRPVCEFCLAPRSLMETYYQEEMKYRK